MHGGGRILVLGNAGIYTEKMRTREEFVLQPVTGVSRFQRCGEMTFHPYGGGQSACLPLGGPSKIPVNHIMRQDPPLFFPCWYLEKEQILSAINRMLGADRQIEVISPVHTAVGLRSTAHGRTAVHLLSYHRHSQPVEIQLKLSQDLVTEGAAQWHTPDAGPTSPSLESDGGAHTCVLLPGFRDYGVLIL